VRDWGQAKHSAVVQRRINGTDHHSGKNGSPANKDVTTAAQRTQ
jgi:hypothetical protein